MTANLENSAVATGLEKVSFHSNPKEWSNYRIIALISHSSKVMLKITADSDCSHEIKRPLLLGRRTMTNLNLILKSRDTTLPAKVHMVKAVVF